MWLNGRKQLLGPFKIGDWLQSEERFASVQNVRHKSFQLVVHVDRLVWSRVPLSNSGREKDGRESGEGQGAAPGLLTVRFVAAGERERCGSWRWTRWWRSWSAVRRTSGKEWQIYANGAKHAQQKRARCHRTSRAHVPVVK